MKALKRIIACVMTVALVISAIPQSHIDARASEEYSGRLWLSGAIPGHRCTSTCLHLRGTDEFLSSIGEATIGLSSVDEDSGVWLNDTDKNALWLVKYHGSNGSYMVGGLDSIDVVANTKVTIKGSFKCSDQATYGEGTVTFEETTFIFDGTTWYESAVADETATLSLTNGTKDGINIHTTTGFQKDDTWTKRAYAVRDGVSGVYVDGQWKDIAIILLKYSEGAENHYFDLTYSAGGAEATAGTKVVIKGKFVCESHVVEFAPSVFVFDGTAWSVESFTVSEIYQENITTDAWQIWMTPKGTLAGENGEMFLWPATLDNEELSGGITIFKDGGMFCAQIWSSQMPCDGSVNATLKIKKGVVTGDRGNVAYLKEDVALCFNEYGVALNEAIGIELAAETTVNKAENVTDGAEDCQYLTFKSLRDYQVFDDGNGWDAWDIWLKPSETLQAEIDEAYQGLQMTVKNGTQIATFSVNFSHAEAFDGSAWLRLDHNLLPLDITEATEVIIHAGAATSVKTGKKIQLIQDCILQIDTSEKWKKPIYDSRTWEIHLELSGLSSGVEGETFIWPAVFENEDIDKKETIVEITKENGEYVLHPTALELPADGTEGRFTLQKSTVIGSEGSVVKLPFETILCVNKYGLQMGEPIVPDTEKVGMTIMPGSTNKTQLYLHAMQTDAFPVDNTWNIRPVAVEGFVEGAYYFGERSGIFIDDVKINPNNGSPLIEFVKMNEFYNAEIPETAKYNEYFIGLGYAYKEDQITDSTTVTLKGLFEYNGQLVEYLPTSFQWDSETSTWNVTVDTTYISGDANGDEKADAKDIVRLKRYETQTDEDAYVIPISMVDADLIMEEDTYKVDGVDLQELQLQLIDAAEIELAAYCGPRRGGYRYYCDNDNDDGSDGDYEGNKTTEILYGTHPEDPEGGWEGWITEKDFQDYLNCGFTHLLPETDAAYDRHFAEVENPVYTFYESDLYPYMELAEKMNVPVLAHAAALMEMTKGTSGVLTSGNKEFLDTIYDDLSKYKMFKGYVFGDEPTYENVNNFSLTKNYLAELDINKKIYTACFPITQEKASLAADTTLSQEAAYTSYMDKFYGTTGSFTYDLYPLIHNRENGNRLDSSWFTNLRVVAEHAKNNQYDAGIVVQSTSYGTAKNYRLEAHPEYHRTVESKADVGFQVYTALAYGMKSINYYSYWTHWSESARGIDTSAMVNYPTESGGEPVKTNAYYAVKAVNQEIKKFDHVFLTFDWQGTMAVAPEEATMSDVLGGVLNNNSNYQPENMTAKATEETIIGCMKDGDGRDGFMIVNATEPSAGKTSKVTIEIANATKAYAYIKGSKTEITLLNGVYELEVGAGEGVFVIPFS